MKETRIFLTTQKLRGMKLTPEQARNRLRLNIKEKSIEASEVVETSVVYYTTRDKSLRSEIRAQTNRRGAK